MTKHNLPSGPGLYPHETEIENVFVIMGGRKTLIPSGVLSTMNPGVLRFVPPGRSECDLTAQPGEWFKA